jgi:hypothetical protein
MRKAEIHIKIDGQSAEINKIVNEQGLLNLLEDLEYFKSEALARQVVKEVFSLKDNDVFKVLRYTFSKKEIPLENDFEEQGNQEW